MDNQQREWLLRALAHTDEGPTGEPTCEDVRDQLGVYVEAELYEEDAPRQFPQIARHLYTCPDCRIAYDMLRDILITGEAPVLAAAEAPVSATSLTPARGSSLADLIAWATEQIAVWQHTLAGRALVYRSAMATDTPPITIPGQGDAVLALAVVTAEGALAISGTITPSSPDLQGLPVRLYAVSADPEPAITGLFERKIDDFDTFSFEGLSPGRYVLTIGLHEGEVGLTFIGGPSDRAL